MAKRFHIPPAMVGEVLSSISPTPTTGVTVTEGPKMPQVVTLTLASVVVSIAAADDFGSVELITLPNSNLLIQGCVVDLTTVALGLTADVSTTIDFAIGTVTTASTTFSNAGEDNLTPKIDGVGAGATGTVKGANDTATINVPILAGASNKVWLNVSSPVAADTGTVTVSGTVKLVILDIGKPTA